MIPSKADIDIKSTMQGEDIQMGIDQKSLVFLQKVLTDLYSDPELAVIREYSTNARDSHLEAGHTKAIEVTTPTSFDPSLHIKDYGIGLSLEDIKTVYSLYGASTKRQNASANGMLGLGCKSALTYTNQFTIRSVKDGELVIVMVTRDEFGAGSMKVVHTGPTNESNGVEVTIPAKQGNKFREKAEDFFSYWEKSSIPVLLNGQTPKYIEALWVTDTIALTSKGGSAYGSRQKAKVHMAGVTYNAEAGIDLHQLNLNYGTSVVFFVEDGAVDFTPSREELHYTSKTNSRMRQCVVDLKEGLRKAMQADIDSAPTHAEAIKAYRRWSNTFAQRPDFNYKGTKPSGMLAATEDYTINSYGNNSYHDRSRGYELFSFIIHDSDDRVIVTGKKDKKISTGQRAKLRTWADNKGYVGGVRFVFVERDDCAPWTNHLPHVTWVEILATKPTANKNKIYNDPEHHIYVADRGRRLIDPQTEVDTSKVIAYAYLSDVKPSDEGFVGKLAERAGIKIYGVPKAKLKEFQKNYPQAVYFKQALQDAVDRQFNALSPQDRELIKNDNAVRDIPRSLLRLHTNQIPEIEDPVLKDAVSLAKDRVGYRTTNQPTFDKYNNWIALRDDVKNMFTLNWRDEWSDLDKGNPEYAKLSKKYPLIESGIYDWNSTIREHVIIYLNAIYNEEKKNKNAV